MSLFSTKTGSQHSTDINVGTKDQIKEICRQLQSAKRDSEDFPIPRLKETLTKLQDLLDLCKKTKGSKDAIEQFIALVTKFIEDVLEPVLRETRLGEVEISKVLTDHIQRFFRELFDAVPAKRQLFTSSFNRMFQSVDLGSALADANPKIDTALQSFLSQGNIRCHVRPDDNRRVLDVGQGGEHIDRPIQENQSSQHRQPRARSPASGTDRSDLEPTIRGVLEALPRFRILLLGKSGVGKSSLINNIFRVPLAEVAHFRAGGADINEEITSDSNPHFILHDSLGYESGSIEHFQIVENFIKQRSQNPDISEQIHAIWLCTAVPVSGARVFEVGDERLFQMDLGRVPLIVVFTKYDSLVARTAMEIVENEDIEDEDEVNDMAKVGAEKEFSSLCIQPLGDIFKKKLERTDLPALLKVSVKPGYEDTLSQLVQLTRQSVANVVDQVDQVRRSGSGRNKNVRRNEQTVWLTWAIAQRADADTSVDASIAVGRKKFWRGLGSSLYFQEKALKRCLDALHEDIVLVWNFYDPGKILISDQFKALMTQSIDDLADKDAVNPNTALAAGISGAAGLTGLVGALMPPGAIIVGPIAVVAVLAKWAYDVYQQTPGVLRCLMAYIVDLTIIMRRLFWHVREKGGIQPLPEELLRQAFDEFSNSRSKALMHAEIKAFVDKGSVLDRAKKDKVLDEVVRLINKYRFDPVSGGE